MACLHCCDLKVGLFNLAVILLARIILGFVPCKNLIASKLCILSGSSTPISFLKLGVAVMLIHFKGTKVIVLLMQCMIFVWQFKTLKLTVTYMHRNCKMS